MPTTDNISPAARHKPAHGGYPDSHTCPRCKRPYKLDPIHGKISPMSSSYCIGFDHCLIRRSS